MSDEKKDVAYVPYYVVEAQTDRLNSMIRKLWAMCLLLIILLVMTNGMWIWYESQFVYETTTIEAEQDGEGVNIVGAGDINYGTESKSN